MKFDVVVPNLGESVSEGVVLTISKKVGDFVKKDEVLAELETDKVTMEIYAPSEGEIETITCKVGDKLNIGAVMAIINSDKKGSVVNIQNQETTEAIQQTQFVHQSSEKNQENNKTASPAAIKNANAMKILIENVAGSGKRGQVIKEDVLNAVIKTKEVPVESTPIMNEWQGDKQNKPIESANEGNSPHINTNNKPIEVVKMSKLRQTIAKRLKDAQNTAAILTTFNEIDMTEMMSIRGSYKDAFEKKYGVKLGFMSFFAKASAMVLREIPVINAEISGENVIYKNYYDIGVAVGTNGGLVVPVIRGVDKMSFDEVEKSIAEAALKAREGKLTIEALQGGTFTISNGGVYGSLLSTPIINPPQSAILGLHNITKRAVVMEKDDQIVARPMMYVALSYDHRIIDGKEAVTFLLRLKQLCEDPKRILLGV